jgi:ribosomal peptide maturation radical SAM protein 1
MQFRQKSPEKVLDMVQSLARRYGTIRFSAIDNILAPEYAEKLFGRLAEEKSDLRFHYEIRPNVSRPQLRNMRLGGLESVQPGVESLSTHVLTLMKKFTTGMRNLELLKWTTYYGIENHYNLLYGFPGETADDYAAQASVLRKVPHLQPPYCMAPARADRGSPMFERPAEHGVSRLRPEAVYRFIYPAQFDLTKISYFFEDDRPTLPSTDAYRECIDVVDAWKQRWEKGPRPRLTYVKARGTLTIHDERWGPDDMTRLDDRAARLYELCADARRKDDLVHAFDGDSAWVDRMLADLVGYELIAHLDDKYLALALPANPNH